MGQGALERLARLGRLGLVGLTTLALGAAPACEDDPSEPAGDTGTADATDATDATSSDAAGDADAASSDADTSSDADAQVEEPPLLGGVAEHDLGFPLGTATTGFGPIQSEPSPYAQLYPASLAQHTELTAKALVLQRGDSKVALVRTDTVGIWQDLVEDVRAVLARVVEGEDPSQPFSDEELVQLMRERGYELARRTVAKYRGELGIRSSYQRRRFVA